MALGSVGRDGDCHTFTNVDQHRNSNCDPHIHTHTFTNTITNTDPIINTLANSLSLANTLGLANTHPIQRRPTQELKL